MNGCDQASLVSSLSQWEAWGYAALAAVAVGVIGVSIREFSPWLKHFGWEKIVGRASAAILMVGLVGAGVTQLHGNLATKQLLQKGLPRTISTEQRALIVQLLRPENIHKGPVLINAAMEGEAWQFSEDIKTALTESGFAPTNVSFGNHVFAFSKAGAFIWVKDNTQQPDDGGPIAAAFCRAGIKLIAEEHPEIPDIGTIIIAVSARP